MASKPTYVRRTDGNLLRTDRIADILPDWQAGSECWLFISPHDDDVVTGAGLTFQTGIAEGAQVHAAVVTDGRMGYCRMEQRDTVAAVRQREAKASFLALGLPAERLSFLDYPDGHLSAHRGAYFRSNNGAPRETTGLQVSFTRLLRQVRPNRVFVATSADLHPDHLVTHQELMISLFHASGNIWPELGEPITSVPQVYEYAVYCDFPEPPQIRIETPPEMLDVKLDGIRAFASQEQIGALVEIQRAAGPIEYIRELKFRFYSPHEYDKLFAG